MTEIQNQPAGALQARLAVEGAPTSDGGFEILAITAGEGNGWQFTPAALQESLALWDSAECFVDHAWGARSLRDLAGVLSTPQWDAACQGVRCQLRPLGPSGSLLAELGRQVLADSDGVRVGFSADLLFTAQGRQVEKILRVLSVDLVFNPARGGAFVRALNAQNLLPSPISLQGASPFMDDTLTSSTAAPAPEPSAQQELSAARQLRLAMCQNLLETALTAAQLPVPLADQLRARFSAQIFEPAQLTAAIADARLLHSQLTAPQLVQGLRPAAAGRIEGIVSSRDQFQAALCDLLGARRPEGLQSVHPARFSGIRELYTLMTGDLSFTGGCDPSRAQFATSADLPSLLKDTLNKIIVQEWEELGRSGYRWWEPVVSVQHFNSLQPITGVLVGEVNLLPQVAEGAPYTPLDITDSSETGAWTKYGGYIGLTLEMFERDETHKLRQYPKKLASSALRRISALVGSVFTGSLGVGPLMSDGFPVFHANHGNLGAADLSAVAWETASSAIYKQPLLTAEGGAAPIQALDARYLLVPRGLRLTGWQIIYPSLSHETNIFSDNMQRGEQGDVITCPEFGDANHWAALADPLLAPAIIIGERFGVLPEIILSDSPTSGALFTNDEMRMKVRHWVSVFVADHRPLYKSNPA